MIRKDEIPILFVNKLVKLVKKNNFVLYGYIREINDTSLLFETDQATASISLDMISDIVLKKEENHE